MLNIYSNEIGTYISGIISIFFFRGGADNLLYRGGLTYLSYKFGILFILLMQDWASDRTLNSNNTSVYDINLKIYLQLENFMIYLTD